ncbi:MAG: hypothetical protein ABSB66_12815 [Candidatus Acidiferrales bacterium]
MQAIERLPATGGLDSKALRKLLGRLVELANDTLDSIRENTQLLEEAGAFGKEHTVEKLIPVGGILRRLTTKIFRVQWFH